MHMGIRFGEMVVLEHFMWHLSHDSLKQAWLQHFTLFATRPTFKTK